MSDVQISSGARRRRAAIAEDGAGFVPRLCMQDPVERAGPSGTCEDVTRSYAALRAASMSGNGTSRKYFPEHSFPDPFRSKNQ